MCVFDQAWYICNREIGPWALTRLVSRPDDWSTFIVVQDNRSNAWRQRGESPIPNPCPAVAHRSQQGALSGIGQSHKTNVGKQFQLKLQRQSYSQLALACKLRFGCLSSSEVRISQSTHSTGS